MIRAQGTRMRLQLSVSIYAKRKTLLGYQRRGRPDDLRNEGRGKRELELPKTLSWEVGRVVCGDAKTSITKRRYLGFRRSISVPNEGREEKSLRVHCPLGKCHSGLCVVLACSAHSSGEVRSLLGRGPTVPPPCTASRSSSSFPSHAGLQASALTCPVARWKACPDGLILCQPKCKL